MHTLKLLLLILLFPLNLMAQDTIYYNNQSKPCIPADAAYYRVITKEKDHFLVKEYYSEGGIRMEGHFISLNPEVRTGAFTIYNPYGGINIECNYINNVLDGDHTTYDLYNNIIAKYKYSNGVITDTIVKEAVQHDDAGVDYIEDIVDTADVMPQFPGGKSKMEKFIRNNLRYPSEAVKNKVAGTVYVKCIITYTGKISDIYVERGIGYGCDEEAARVVQMMPDWQPGKKDNKKIHVWITIPVKFSSRK